MPLRVGFDLDGTVADMYFALRREAVALFGDDVLRKSQPSSDQPQKVAAEQSGARPDSEAPEDDPGASPAIKELHLTAQQQDQLWNHVRKIENFWMTLPELEPGVIARIARTARQRRWEVIFLTTRPSSAGDLVQLQSQRWLESQGFQYPSVFVVQRSRGKIADALQLDAFVDDRPENCLDIAVESKAKVLLIWHGDPKDVPAGAKRLGVRTVTRISDAITLLEQFDDIRRQPSLLRSIKRSLGRGGLDS